MKEIDEYFFPYVDIAYYFPYTNDKLQENTVYFDLISDFPYRYINGELFELNQKDIFESGLIDNNQFKKVFLRFLKEKHILNEYIRIFLTNKNIKDIENMFNDENFVLNNIFKYQNDNESIDFADVYYEQFQEFSRLYYIDMIKIK